MKTIATKAIVLSRINYGEADKILTLLTSEQGKVSVIAKGVRKPKSKLAGGAELFSVSDISYIDTPKELKTLISARLSKNYGNIVKDLHTTNAAYDIIKYAGLYTESLCEDDFFWITVSCLEALHRGNAHEVVFVWFGVRLLQLAGHAIDTRVSVGTQTTYIFDQQEMCFREHPQGMLQQNHIKLMRIMLANSLEKVERIQNAQQYCHDMVPLMAQTLKIYSIKNL
jgi:DNA repair protein RecO (recombination protein O)